MLSFVNRPNQQENHQTTPRVVKSKARANYIENRLREPSRLPNTFPTNRTENPAPSISPNLIQKKENKTGLPDRLKFGIENLSGYAMDDVRVHYNSNKPAQLQSHAYVQGTDIHIAPRQEKHLPHEAWHVVQQKQGRVKPTMQMKRGVNVNDEVGLEREADVMGAKAMTKPLELNKIDSISPHSTVRVNSSTIQRKIGFEIETGIKLGYWKKRDTTEGGMYEFRNATPGEKIKSGNWEIEVESAAVTTPLEFVTKAFEEDKREEVLQAGEEIAETAKAIGAKYFDLERNQLHSVHELEGKNDLPRLDKFLKKHTGGKKPENYITMVTGPSDITGAMQMTGGFKLSKVNTLMNAAAAKTIGDAGSFDVMDNISDKTKTIRSGLDAFANSHLALLGKDIPLEEKEELHGFLSLLYSYLNHMIIQTEDHEQTYAKFMFPFLNKSRFSDMFKALPSSVKEFVNADTIAKTIGKGKNEQLIKGKWKAGPNSEEGQYFESGLTINNWVDSIKNPDSNTFKRDYMSGKFRSVLFSQNKSGEKGTRQLMTGSPSMGAYDMDTDPNTKKKLAIIELRRIQKNMPPAQWAGAMTELFDWAVAINQG